MNDNKTSGFARLRGLAAAATVGFGAMAVPGTAGVSGRALGPTLPVSSTRETKFNVYKAFGGGESTPPTASMEWLGIGNGSTSVTQTYTTTTTQYLTQQTSDPRTYITTYSTPTAFTTIFTSYTSSDYFTTTSPSNYFGYSSTYCTTASSPSTTGSGAPLYSCTGYYYTGSTWTTPIGFTSVTSAYTTYGPRTVITDTVVNTGVVRTTSESVETGFQIADGRLNTGPIRRESLWLEGDGLFDGILKMDVNGEDFINPSGIVQFDGDTAVTSKMLNVVAGINASMELFFSDELPFVRAMYILENSTEADIEAQLAVNGDLAYDANTTVQTSSDGDAVAEATDRWVAVNNSGSVGSDGAGDVILVTRYGSGASVVPSDAAALGDGEADVFRHVYDVTVPANGKVRVVVFVGVAESLAAGQDMARALSRSGDVLLEDLSAAELKEVVNYGDVPQIAQDLSDDGLELIGSAGWVTLLGGFGLMLRRRRQH